ncbi:MAG: HPr family phosphocarrier protein [Eubacterium sp.]|nr:HPr family phosphocarrier protein [Eubacterium sp.]
MVREEVIIRNRAGLHAKPASLFVQKSNQFVSEIYIVKDEVRVNAKSIMGIMILGVHQGDAIVIETSGDDEQEAAAALKELVDNNFGLADEG